MDGEVALLNEIALPLKNTVMIMGIIYTVGVPIQGFLKIPHWMSLEKQCGNAKTVAKPELSPGK